MAGHLLFNSGSNESSLAPQFKWLDNTFNNVAAFVPESKTSLAGSALAQLSPCRFKNGVLFYFATLCFLL